jgi:hypothetical protein
MEGSVVLPPHSDAAGMCRALTLGSVRACRGEKLHELLYDIDYIDID